MENKILVDTDFLFALVVENDVHHKVATEKMQQYVKDMFFITPFTIPEAVTVLSYKVSQDQAKRFLKQARESNFAQIVFDESIISKADELFLAQKKKGTSWIDCLNVAVILSNHLDGILSFDRFYQQVGIRVF